MRKTRNAASSPVGRTADAGRSTRPSMTTFAGWRQSNFSPDWIAIRLSATPSTPTTSSRKWNLKDICSGTRAPSSQTNIWRRSSKGHDNFSWKGRPRSNCAAGTAMPPNFVLLDAALPDVARLMAAMVQARDAVEHRSWSHPQEPTGEAWWADVLADPRARKRERRTDLAVKQAFYRLADEKREIILVACSKCDWRAAFSRDDLIATHGADYAMPNLLNQLAAPTCSRLGSHWDRCGVHYVEPIEGARWRDESGVGRFYTQVMKPVQVDVSRRH